MTMQARHLAIVLFSCGFYMTLEDVYLQQIIRNKDIQAVERSSGILIKMSDGLLAQRQNHLISALVSLYVSEEQLQCAECTTICREHRILRLLE